MSTGIEIDRSAIIAGVIERVSADLVAGYEDFSNELHSRVEALVQERVEAKCDAVVQEIIDKRLDEFVFQITNRFGEEKGEPITFTEYLIGRADEYLMEPVDHNGKSITQDAYSRSKAQQTRLTHMIDTALQWQIATAMKDAVKKVLNTVAPALSDTCTAQIKKAVADLTKSR